MHIQNSMNMGKDCSLLTGNEDLEMEILARLPLKTLAMCICTMKDWANLIRSNDFRVHYEKVSKSRPQLLFYKGDFQELHLISQERTALLASDVRTVHLGEGPVEFSRPHRGLICAYKRAGELWICNPSTGKRMVAPKTPEGESGYESSFYPPCLGYDEEGGNFKVFRFMETKSPGGAVSEGCILWTVGENNMWRRIKFDQQHVTPYKSNAWLGGDVHCKGYKLGPCIGGATYFISEDYKLVSFNFTTEEITIVGKFPEDIINNLSLEKTSWELINYKGKVGLVDEQDRRLKMKGHLQLWVWNGHGKFWKEKNIVIKRWKALASTPGNTWRARGPHYNFRLRGTIGRSILVFTEEHPLSGFFVLYYNKMEETFEKFKIEGVDVPDPTSSNNFIETYVGHVESLMLF